MKYSSFNIDLVGGVIPPKTHKSQPVKTNTFYRDAFIQDIQGCPNLPSDLKRKMGLTQIFSDDSQKNNQFTGNKGMTKKRSLGSILPSCSLNFNRQKLGQIYSKPHHPRTISQPNLLEVQLNEKDAMMELVKKEQNRILFAKISASKEIIGRQVGQYSTPLTSSSEKRNSSTKDIRIESIAQQLPLLKDKKGVSEHKSESKVTSRSLPGKQTFYNQKSEGQLEQERMQCRTAGQLNRPSRGQDNLLKQRQNSKEIREQQRIKEIQLLEHERKNKMLLENELKDELLADQEEKGLLSNRLEEQEDLMDSEKQREARILLGMHALSEGMYKNLQKEQKGVLISKNGSKLPIETLQNQHFSNQQTIFNERREASNSEQRKELLSCFNENRYRYFSNNDLNAEKFFVTRNRERIKNLNFERIGIFKSKQPKTHVNNFRFFINDIHIQEPRFQGPLKSEQEQLSYEHSARKASFISKQSSSEHVKQDQPVLISSDLQQQSKQLLPSPTSQLYSPLAKSPSLFSRAADLSDLNENITKMQQFDEADKRKSQLLQEQDLSQSDDIKKDQSPSNILLVQQSQAEVENSYSDNSSSDSPGIRKLKMQYTNFMEQQILEDGEESGNEEEKGSEDKRKKFPNRHKRALVLEQVGSEEEEEGNEKIKDQDHGRKDQNSQGKEDQKERDQSQVAELSSNEVIFTESGDSIVGESSLLKQTLVNNAREIHRKNSSNSQFLRKSPQFTVSPVGFKDDTAKINELIGNIEKSQGEFLENKLNDKDQQDSVQLESAQFENDMSQLEQQQKELEDIEHLFFLKLSPEETEYYNSENFKIERKKVLLDTILKNKKISNVDKKLIFQNLIYQYNPRSKMHTANWCKQMTKFLLSNKFKYNLDEAANRKYERPSTKIIHLPTFREPQQEFLHNFQNYLSSLNPSETEQDEEIMEENDNEIREVQEDDDENELDEEKEFGKEKENNRQQPEGVLRRFQPKPLPKDYSHFQFFKLKY